MRDDHITTSTGLRPETNGRLLRAPLALAVAGLAIMPAAAAHDIAAASRAASCNACHGPAGRSIAGIPPLAGRPAQELYEMLLAFKTDRRPSFVMGQHAKGYTDEQLRAIAEVFAREKPSAEAPR